MTVSQQLLANLSMPAVPDFGSPQGISLWAILTNFIWFAFSLIGLIATAFLIYRGWKVIESGDFAGLRSQVINTIVGIGVILCAGYVVSYLLSDNSFLVDGQSETVHLPS